MDSLWFIGIMKVHRYDADPFFTAAREEADKVMKAIGGKVIDDEGEGCYHVRLPDDLDVIAGQHGGSFTINITLDDEGYELTLE